MKARVLGAFGAAVVTAALLVGVGAPAGVAVTEGQMFTVEWEQGGLYSVDAATAGKTLVAPTTPPVLASTGIQYDPAVNRLWAVTYDGPCLLYSIDPDTGASTLVGDTGAVDCTGLDQQPSTGTLSIVYDLTEGGESMLATVDKATGARSDIGSVIAASDSSDVRVAGLAYSPDGTFFAGGYDGNLYSMDPATAVVTLVGPLDLTSGDPMGMAFDCDGTLFVNDDTDLFSVDPETAVSTLVGTLWSPEEEGFSENLTVACSVPPPAPPPPDETPAAPLLVVAPRFTG